jgi:hypothetical protein
MPAYVHRWRVAIVTHSAVSTGFAVPYDQNPATRPASPLAFWMQTTGTRLLVVQLCSLAYVWLAAQDGRGVPGLLYFAANTRSRLPPIVDHAARRCLRVLPPDLAARAEFC